MVKLIYASNVSVDGFTEDAHGGIDWAPPDDDVFTSITDLMGSAGTYLYGRRMYETLAVWESDPTLGERSALTARYARAWQAADKVVYSSSLPTPSTRSTRLERHFDPLAVSALKSTADSDLLIGGPHLAAQAMAAGLVDEIELFVWPVLLGGRNRALPDDVSARLELIDERRFPGGAVRLRHRVLHEDEGGPVTQDRGTRTSRTTSGTGVTDRSSPLT